MKYCNHCGKEIADEAVVCPICGCQVPSVAKDVAGIGLKVLSFLFPIIGLILWLVYHDQYPMRAKAIAKFALIGFAVGVVFSILSFAGTLLASLSVINAIA